MQEAYINKFCHFILKILNIYDMTNKQKNVTTFSKYKKR